MKLTAVALAGILGLASASNSTVRHCTGECQSGKGACPPSFLFCAKSF